MRGTKIKICCISSIQEAQMVMKAEVDAIGLVGEMPSGPGQLSDEMIKEIIDFCDGRIDTFLLTSRIRFEDIVEHITTLRPTTVQLVNLVDIKTISLLKKEIPHTKIVKVIHVQNEKSVTEAIEFAQYADVLLLDSGSPSGNMVTLGGTGKTHNWDISASIVQEVSIPVFLAGGLRPDNVSLAISTVKPYGVDVCSGVRQNDSLDQAKLTQFLEKI